MTIYTLHLGMVVVVAEILFSGISGSSVADASAIGSIMIPPLKRAGYSEQHSVSIITAASGAGMLIPPCLVMIVMVFLGSHHALGLAVACYAVAIWASYRRTRKAEVVGQQPSEAAA